MKYRNFKDINNKIPKPGSFKHFLRIQENGGRVVKGVNTTADVDTNSIKKQAAKFGNTVDKDGRPPTLSKKVKGSKTNVLFNLGMTESVDNTDESVLYYAKMAENLGELASTSKVYVDMDGVLADFFGEWQKLIGSDWRKVKDIEPALQAIRDKDNFWLDLPLLPQAKNLLGVIKKVKGSYTILSSPLPNDPNSEPHKREWIKKNLSFFPPENVIITHDKPKYATNSDGTPNILIDDFGKNIASWEAAGGEGFKHKDHKFERTAKAIKQHMTEPVDEAFDTKINWEKDPEDHGDVDAYIAYIGYKEVGIQYFFEPINAGGVILPGLDITFEVNGATKKTGGGDASTIFGAVINHIKQFIEQHNEIDVIQFSASKEQGLSRTRLYSAMVDKLSKGTDWINAKTISKADKSVKDADMFKLVRRSAVNDKMVGVEESKQLDEIAFAAPALPFLMPVVGFAVRKGGKKLLDLLGRSAAAKATADNLNLEKELSDKFPGIDVNAVPKNYDDAIQRIARNPLPNFDKDSKDQWKKDPNLDDVLAFLISLIGSTLLKILLAAGLSILAIYALSKTAKYFKKKHDEKKLKQTIDQMIQANSKPVEEAPEDKINKKIVQKAQGMMKPMYSSEIAALVEDEFEAIREAALRRYKKANGKIDLYTAYTMAIEDEFPEIPNPIFVFQYMTDPVDPDHQDLVPQEAEDGSWADRADKEYQQNPKDGGFDGKIKGRWFAIKADRDSYMDQGMEPEDALDKAAERHGVDPEEVEKWIAAGNAVKIKERKLTKGEEKKKEKNVKGMKKNKGDFEKRYGKDAKAVMYATATKMAKESLLWSIETGQDLNESIDKIIQVLEEMDRREFMKTAGATAALSAMPGIAKAMSNDKLIVKSDNGKVFDISKFPGTLQEKIDSFKDSIKKVYAKINTDVPSFKFYLNDKFLGSMNNIGNTYKKVPGEEDLDALAKRMRKENFADDDAVVTETELKKELYAVQKAIDDIYDDPNWKTRRDELKKLIRRESELEKEMGLVRPGNMYRYDHDSFGNKIKENFADGKKKGKSRPGRVKKSGASCSSSVTELRKKAKNASGERAKMYHWCANMKSGKKK